MTNRMTVQAYAKINLCLDVVGLLPGGYHEVNMILQQVELHDDVTVSWEPQEEAASGAGIELSIHTNRPDLPASRRNLAWQAAELMAGRYGTDRQGHIHIDIEKRIPVAAGLAGGSSNCAAVLHGLNKLWELNLSLDTLCQLGSELGSDIPFCVMGQAAADPGLAPDFAGSPMACHCAIASGRGVDLEPIPGLVSHLVLSKPPISVSTAEAYRGVDEAEIPAHPNVAEMASALGLGDMATLRKNMINVLENFTLAQYPIVVYTKDKMQDLCNPEDVLMSGSGPTVFSLCESEEEAKRVCRAMREVNRESFWTRTTR